MALLVGLVFFGPEELFRWTNQGPQQTSIVLLVQRIGPIWSFLFTAMGVALIGAATMRRWTIHAHVLAVFGWLFYGTSILLGSALSEPPAPIISGVMAAGVAGIHYALIQAHQEAGST